MMRGSISSGAVIFAFVAAVSLQVSAQNFTNLNGTIDDLSDVPISDRVGISNNNNRATVNEEKCKCVPYFECRNFTHDNDDIGVVKSSQLCVKFRDVCCKQSDILETEKKISEPETTTRRDSRGCGRRNADGVGFRILKDSSDDNRAQFGEFPWMVAVFHEEPIDNYSEKLFTAKCGGSLINERVVLTAAHCVNGKQPSQLKIRAGEWDTQAENELYAHQDRDVETVVVHENFNNGSLDNDVAILILKTPVNLAENVDFVCLPQFNENFDGSRCLASGWGKDVFGEAGKNQAILKKVELPVIPNDLCQTALRTTRLGKYFILKPSFICAGGEAGKDTCKGDGGSPLVCPLKNDPTRYAQVGIVAWGIGCGENQIPSTYGNVARFRQWIDEQMVYHNLDNTVYQAN